MGRGIDYSGPLGAVENINRDPVTGIRYGVISQHVLSGDALDDFEAHYTARCPHCADEIPDDTHFTMRTVKRPGGAITNVYATDCPSCGKLIREDDQYSDEPDARVVDDGKYQAHLDSAGDAWFTKSPYYTRAAFCSPCAPGACYITSSCDDGERCFCPGPDWFEEGAPFPIYKVENDERVNPLTTFDSDGAS
jgi:hypothetical protein